MDPAVAALTAQHAELAGLLAGLTEPDWHATTRCEGWDVADVVLHLAQTDEMAIASATGSYSEVIAGLAPGWRDAASVDDGAASMVAGERGLPSAALAERWSSGAGRLVGVLDAMDLSTRVDWVAGELSARTLATTRLAETWIHAGDVAGAVGAELTATDRLRPIARLAWRTLPYAFTSAGRAGAGPVAFRLVSPDGDEWDFLPDGPAVTTISGPAADLCAVAARRVEPSATSLRGVGPDVEAVLALVRTYA
ncbi:MAG TPA: maleylpyruvate isomerase family mycothiol-dependent enzyme [Acidimicrobiales bacterium]|nr:maleylpyruvate isomerase family mycothiol-dependent enzyme [Acidimicrobiales bacterium]